jgi:hypothetical protein
MKEEKKQKVVWWLEAIRVIIAAVAGLLGGTAM